MNLKFILDVLKIIRLISQILQPKDAILRVNFKANARPLALTLILTLPLGLYFVPYAYAAVTTTSYMVFAGNTTGNVVDVHCNAGDYATGGGSFAALNLVNSNPEIYDFGTGTYSFATSGTPNAWHVAAGDTNVAAWVVCQTPITVAGIGVPEFGSLYVAIALGALLYFVLSRRFAGKTDGVRANQGAVIG